MPTKTPIEPSLIARVVTGIRDTTAAWFGPGRPMQPVAPPEVRGRAFDYPVAVNLNFRPRGEQGENGIDFASLRALADPTIGGLDLLRLAIETRKDQMDGQKWAIGGRDGSDGGDKARAIEQALRKPDRVHSFRVWRRMLLDDLFTIDAPTVYIAPSTGPFRIPQVMDGALLKRLTNPDGRIPMPPEPAFQQTLKGMPAVDYSLDELVYGARNLRSNRLYGMSPVEQVVMTVQIALRRQLSQLEFYTAGSIPDMVFGAPESWTSDQIRQFQGYWDSILSGNTEERRRARFVPGGVTPMMLKPDGLKDAFDEWLARIICFAFSLPPSALVKEVNRATAETAKEAGQEEGLEPIKLWWSDFMAEVLEKAFDAPELELVYTDEEISDAETKAKVMSLSLAGKPWLTADEVRAKYGEQPLTPEQKDELAPPPPPMLALPPGPDAGAEARAAEAKAKVELAVLTKQAEPVHAMAAGLGKIAESLRRTPLPPRVRSMQLVRDPSGQVTGANVTEET